MKTGLKPDWQAQYPMPFDVVKCSNGYFALAASNGRSLTWTVPPGSSDVAAMTYIATCTNRYDALQASHKRLLAVAKRVAYVSQGTCQCFANQDSAPCPSCMARSAIDQAPEATTCKATPNSP